MVETEVVKTDRICNQGGMNNTKKIALIPAYEPDERLIEIVNNLKLVVYEKFDIVVVDDGSGEKYRNIFSKVSKSAKVISYEENHGKGYALKTGIKYIIEKYKSNFYIVTMDSDGQHTVDDAVKLLECLENNDESIILGKRLRGENTPFRSKFGNCFSMLFFKAITGKSVYDTQTGLRAFSYKLADKLLNIDGDRYEYEMNMLIECASNNIDIKEVDIKSIYIDNNSGSHFRAIQDSYLIYKQPLKFIMSSISSFIVDYILYSLIFVLSGGILLSNILARILSSIFNYSLNKKIVFNSKKKVYKSAIEYAILAIFILVLNTSLLSIFINICKFNPYISKVIVEIVLFTFSWIVQKRFVFKDSKVEMQKRRSKNHGKEVLN